MPMPYAAGSAQPQCHPPCCVALQYECEDVLAGDALFDALGVGLGRGEMMDVAMAVKRLGEDPARGVATVRAHENAARHRSKGHASQRQLLHS